MKSKKSRRRVTVADLIDRYRMEVLPRQPRTEKNQRAHLKWWEQEIGHILLKDVRPAFLVEYRNKLEREVTYRGTRRGPATVNRYFATLGRVFTLAIREWEWLDDSPLRRLSKLREPPGRSRFLSTGERKRLLRVCRESPNQDLYLAVVLSISTGARQMEIMGLRWQDIDLSRGLIILNATKNGVRRSIPLQSHARELVAERHRQCSGAGGGLLFPGRRKPQKPTSLRISWNNALKAAGIEDFRWHDLRHSAASYLAMHGATLVEIADILGHKTLQMVKRYAHLSIPHTTRVVARMNRGIFPRHKRQEARDLL